MPYKNVHQQKQYQKRWSRINKERLNSQCRTTRRKFFLLLDRYKQFVGCKVCGYKEFPFALDLHHVDPTTKLGSPNTMLRSGGVAAAKKEVRKCVVLCAVCHRAVTAGVIDLL